MNAFIKLDECIHGVTVVIPTNDREIPGSTPGRYNLQIKITSNSIRSNHTHPEIRALDPLAASGLTYIRWQADMTEAEKRHVQGFHVFPR